MAFSRWDDDCDVHVYLGRDASARKYTYNICLPDNRPASRYGDDGLTMTFYSIDEAIGRLIMLDAEGVYKVPQRVMDRMMEERKTIILAKQRERKARRDGKKKG